MSTYQYYEFQALDRPLSSSQQERLHEISSRAQISSRSFVNVYNYGDLRGDERKILAAHFDALVYVANWGTRRLAFRFPSGALDPAALAPYRADEALDVASTRGHLIIGWASQDEEPGWEDGEGWMDELVALREEILRGDRRPLYIGWLCGVEAHRGYGDDIDAILGAAPPVPPGLGALTPAQEKLVDFLRIDPELLTVAAEGAPDAVAGPRWDELAELAAGLDGEEKDRWLFRLFEGDEPNLSALFLRRLLQEIPSPEPPTRSLSASALVAEAEARAEARWREEQRKKAEAKAQRARAKAARQEAALDALEVREDAAWVEVGELVGEKRAKSYDRAVALLLDLRALAARRGNEAGFAERLRTLLAGFNRLPALYRRLEAARLPTT